MWEESTDVISCCNEQPTGMRTYSYPEIKPMRQSVTFLNEMVKLIWLINVNKSCYVHDEVLFSPPNKLRDKYFTSCQPPFSGSSLVQPCRCLGLTHMWCFPSVPLAYSVNCSHMCDVLIPPLSLPPDSQTWSATATTPTSSAWSTSLHHPGRSSQVPGLLTATEWTCSSPADWKSLAAGPSIPAQWGGPQRGQPPAPWSLKTVSHFLLLTPWKTRQESLSPTFSFSSREVGQTVYLC